ncbi:carbohydrate-binding family 9-like protein [Pontibacter sp. HJ8]
MRNSYLALCLAFVTAACAPVAPAAFTTPENNTPATALFEGLEHLFTEPKQYTTHFTSKALNIDGHLNDEVWQQAAWTDLFTDIEGDKKSAPTYPTRVKMTWDNQYLYIAAELKEPHVWANLTEHDEVVYYDNDFEVFLDPDNDTHQYFEVEVNALNTIFDLFLSKPYRNNNGALIGWDVHGLKSAVQVQGTLNDPTDTDESWTVEMAIPFRSVTIGNHTLVPTEGTQWRINFSRVQWDVDVVYGKYVKRKGKDGKPLPEYNWVWSPQGVINMHLPERWGYLYFSRKPAGEQSIPYAMPYVEKQKQYLWLVYYRQKEYFGKHGRYSKSLQELGLGSNTVEVDGQQNELQLEAGTLQFMAAIQGPDGKVWSINENGLVHTIKGLQ